MNDVLKKTRQYLLDNPMRFDMGTWVNASARPHTCGTVGCIAGIGLLIATDFDNEKVNNLVANGLIEATAQVMELPEIIARHLFLPTKWAESLQTDIFADLHEDLWHGNYRCDLDTIEKMKKWATENHYPDFENPASLNLTEALRAIAYRESIFDKIQARQAIAAIDGLEAHPHYVDWREACEPA